MGDDSPLCGAMPPGSLPTRRGFALLCMGLALLALVPASAQEQAVAKPAGKLTAFVAASTTEMMGKLAQAFEKETGVAVEVVPGCSCQPTGRTSTIWRRRA